MSEMTTQFLDSEIEKASRVLAEAQRNTADHQGKADSEQRRADRIGQHLSTLTALRSMMRGDFEPLGPRDVASEDDVLGMRMGPLLVAPGPDASVEDLRLYAAMLRAVRNHATHQIRLANDKVAEDQHRQEQAVTDTTSWDPAQVVNGSAPSQTVPDRSAPFHCSRCGEPLHQHGNSWVDQRLKPCCEGDALKHLAVMAEGGRVDQQPTSVRFPADMVPPIDQTQVVPAQPSPPPADQPTPPGQPLHEADPVRRVDLSEAQGSANHG